MDCFALLGEPRRPWLDPESLKQKFLTRSAQIHPDRLHNASPAEKAAAQQRFTELNAAFNRLREPKERLAHLLELELGARPKQVERIPEELVVFFTEVNQACREADALLAEKHRTTSPLLQVQLFERCQDCAERLTALLQKMNAEQEALGAEIEAIDAKWNAADRKMVLQRLEDVYRRLSFFTRWSDQLRERNLQLTL
jgi:DnaJ-domain-containing protein 1